MHPHQAHLERWFDDEGVAWTRLEHPRVTTAVEAAEVRGTPLDSGGKTLLFKAGKRFVLAVVPGARRIDNRSFRKALRVQRYRFARREELDALIGLEPGCIPPFAAPLVDLPLVMDAHLASQPTIAFTMANHTVSAVLAMEDYLALAKPEIVPLTLG